MLGCVPKWNVTHGEAQEVKDMEERSKRLSIKRMIDEKGRNSQFLWSDLYRKIIRGMEEIDRPRDRTLRAKSNHLSLPIF